jgi:hypothetical protein
MNSDSKTYKEYVSIIKEKESALEDIFGVSVYRRIIDPNFGNKTVQLTERVDKHAHTSPKEELKKLGLRFDDGIDSLEAGHLKVREMLHYEKKGDEIVLQPKYFITDNCINSIKHLSRYSRKDIMTSDGDVKDKVGVQEKYKDFCFDKETEILTNNGWKNFIDLKDELVATVNLDTFNLEYQKPLRHIRYFYDGKMLYINARCINMMVTPDHKMVVGTQLSGYKGLNSRRIEFRTANQITPQMVIPISCNGVKLKNDAEEKLVFDKKTLFPRSIKKSLVVLKRDWAAFLGIYISEGSATGTKGGKIQMPGRGYSVYIAQSKNSRHLQEIKDLLYRLPFKFRYNGRFFVCSDKFLWEYLRPLGNSYQKYIPEEFFGYSKETLLEMWKFLVMGDGWSRGNGVDTYCTVSKRLFDDIQRLLVLSGIPSGITIRKPGNRIVDGSIIKKQPKNGFATQYWISAKINRFAGICKSGQKNQIKNYSLVNYSGEVFCVTVPNGTVVVRRKNRVAISGNCDLDRYFWMSNPKHISGLKSFEPERVKVY